MLAPAQPPQQVSVVPAAAPWTPRSPPTSPKRGGGTAPTWERKDDMRHRLRLVLRGTTAKQKTRLLVSHAGLTKKGFHCRTREELAQLDRFLRHHFPEYLSRTVQIPADVVETKLEQLDEAVRRTGVRPSWEDPTEKALTKATRSSRPARSKAGSRSRGSVVHDDDDDDDGDSPYSTEYESSGAEEDTWTPSGRGSRGRPAAAVVPAALVAPPAAGGAAGSVASRGTGSSGAPSWATLGSVRFDLPPAMQPMPPPMSPAAFMSPMHSAGAGNGIGGNVSAPSSPAARAAPSSGPPLMGYGGFPVSPAPAHSHPQHMFNFSAPPSPASASNYGFPFPAPAAAPSVSRGAVYHTHASTPTSAAAAAGVTHTVVVHSPPPGHVADDDGEHDGSGEGMEDDGGDDHAMAQLRHSAAESLLMLAAMQSC